MTEKEIAAHIAECKADPNDCKCTVAIVRCDKPQCPRFARQGAERYALYRGEP